VLRQLDNGLARGRRPGRDRRLAVDAVPPGTAPLRHRAGHGRHDAAEPPGRQPPETAAAPATVRQGGVGRGPPVRVHRRDTAGGRGAGHVQLHHQRGTARGRRVHTAAVHTGHGRRRDHGQRSPRPPVRRERAGHRRVVGRGRAQRADKRQLPGIRRGGRRAEGGRARDAVEAGRRPEAGRRTREEDPVICDGRVRTLMRPRL